MNLRPIICVAVALGLAVAGCAGGVGQQDPGIAAKLHRHVGEGIKKAWSAYLRTPFPDRFALARDGTSYGYIYCPAPTRCPDSGSATFEAIQYCQSGISSKCDIYAQGRRIVWPHAFPWYVAPEVLYDYRESIGKPIGSDN